MTSPSAFRYIPGWFSENEAIRLHKLVFKVPGDILEAGTFCGRATSCICEAIRGRARKFVSYDWATSNAEEFNALIAPQCAGGVPYIPPELKELWQRGTNSYEQAKLYLREAGLLSFVSLIKGDFRIDKSLYDILFLDVVHDEEEITANLPHALRMARTGAWLALHDMKPALLAFIAKEYGSQLQFHTLTDSLALFTNNPVNRSGIK